MNIFRSSMNVLGAGVFVAAATVAGTAAAEYPTQPVTIVVPYGPGGGNDITARFMAEKLSNLWGQPVVVENRPGAGTAIGSAHVARSAPDGYTLLFTSVTYTTMSAVQANLPFDPREDLQPVAQVGAVPLGMATGPKTPATTMDELREAAEAGSLTYSTAGPGSINQFAAELLNQVSGMSSEPIHYSSGNEAITALMGGHVDIYFGSLLQMEPFITDGQVHGLMVTSPERSPSVPDVPTPAESGVAGAEVELWWGMFAPAGTPDETVAAINAGVQNVQAMPETQEFMAQGGARVTPISSAEFTELVHSELDKWREIAEFAGISLD